MHSVTIIFGEHIQFSSQFLVMVIVILWLYELPDELSEQRPVQVVATLVAGDGKLHPV